MRWSAEQVAALAPDAASWAAAQPIGRVDRWKNAGRSDRAAWGEYGGSAAQPYRARLDLQDPAFDCSCPSRKVPCKHGLALALIAADLPEKQAPEWVQSWIDARSKKKAPPAPAPLDPEALERRAADKARRAAERERKVESGVEELARWLSDLVRQGLAAYDDPRAYEETASRMVDAQAPGLARWVQRIGEQRYGGTGWQERALEQVGRLHALLEGWRRRDKLPPNLRADVESQIGFTISRETLLGSAGVKDRWWIAGQRTILEERLRMRRTWLYGTCTQRLALILDFSAGNMPLDPRPAPPACIETELVYYPSAWPMRTMPKGEIRVVPPPDRTLPLFDTISSAAEYWARAAAKNPWNELLPIALRAVVPLRAPDGWRLRDLAGCELPMSRSFPHVWRLAALSGGHPLDVFGEWDGTAIMPLSVFTADGCDPIGAGPTGSLAEEA